MTLDQVDVHIAAWEAASTALAEGRSFRLESGRAIERSDGGEVRRMLSYWTGRRNALVAKAAGAGSLGAVFSRVR